MRFSGFGGWVRVLEGLPKSAASRNRKRGQGRRSLGKDRTLTMLEAFSLAGVGVSVAATKALNLGLENGQGSCKDSGSVSFVFVQKSYTQNFTLPNKKK